jgi:hypothetical protein
VVWVFKLALTGALFFFIGGLGLPLTQTYEDERWAYRLMLAGFGMMVVSLVLGIWFFL